MGVFMASVSFRRPEGTAWETVKEQIEAMYAGLDGLVSNLDGEGPGYAIVSPYGDMGMFLAEMPAKISRLTGGYAVMAMCVDSDFAMMELYHNGEILEKSCIGENYYEELEDMELCGAPDPQKWLPLLLTAGETGALDSALSEVDVFAEDNLRLLSKLTGLPIFDDTMVFGEA